MKRWKNGNLKNGIKRYWNVMHKIGTRLPKAPITEPASQVGVYQGCIGGVSAYHLHEALFYKKISDKNIILQCLGKYYEDLT